MRFRFAIAALVLSMGLNVLGQEAPFKVRSSDVDLKEKDPTNEDRTAHSTVLPAPTASGPKVNKDLQAIERESARTAPAARPVKKMPAALLAPDKQEATPKINFDSGAIKPTGSGQAVPDPLKSRVKQKSGRW
jgi:hypothetical protein